MRVNITLDRRRLQGAQSLIGGGQSDTESVAPEIIDIIVVLFTLCIPTYMDAPQRDQVYTFCSAQFSSPRAALSDTVVMTK
jgi:hypothetical protein